MQLTTLDINKMIHEVSADEETDAQKMPLQPGARIIIPNKEPTKCSIKRNGIVRAYSAITNQGLVRNYNEDRVSIILNITKPAHRKDENWPKCSFFGVYDGHGGHTCAEFLRDQLHHFVIKQDTFPQDPKDAIIKGFKAAEETFLQMCQGRDENGNPIVVDRSGSCAIVILIVGETCYSANVGDSRSIISINGGQIVMPLSRDHKPSDIQEYQRIIKAGG
jgi:protein phosphatase PTC2/3